MATASVHLDNGVEVRTSDPVCVATIFRLIGTTVDDDDLAFLAGSAVTATSSRRQAPR